MNTLPNVVLVGRMNVGKSTLFNRIAKKTQSLIFDVEGVTRDFVRDAILWKKVPFVLIDTGGIALKKVHDPILEKVQQQVLALIQKADVILFMVDGSLGVTQQEFELASYLHGIGHPVIVVANKSDIKSFSEHELELKRLGFDCIAPISAVHNRGIDELLDEVVALLPKKRVANDSTKKRSCRVTFLGRPNVGKSSLMNVLLKEERAIVTDIAGTTREAITEPITFYSETIELTDTAGVRRQKKVDEPLESLMVKSTMQAVRTSDIILLIVDAQEGRLVDQELKLAFYAFEHGKAVVLLMNKYDLMSDYARAQWKLHQDEYRFFYKKLELMPISCKEGKNIGKILPLINQVWQRYLIEFSDQELLTLLKNALIRRPLYKQEHVLQIKHAKQTHIGPPIITLKMPHAHLFGEREYAFFENVVRGAYDLTSVPVKFVVEKKKRD
jgi:GTPase